jgi:TRADD-N domain-containing protein
METNKDSNQEKSIEEPQSQQSEKLTSRHETKILQGVEKKENGAGAKSMELNKQFIRWLGTRGKLLRNLVLILILSAMLLASVALGYFCWFEWFGLLWKWGFDPPTWRGIFSVLGAFYLVFIPFVPFYLLRGTSGIFKLSADKAEKQIRDKLEVLEDEQKFYEELLTDSDSEKLIPLVRFSSSELKQYYNIGLNQTRRSFKYSMVAMWIGFFIILFGIISYIAPLWFTIRDSIGENFKILTIGSGIVTEMIAALFLWIYKSSINQLTYFYNRQVFIHNSLLAFRIAGTMKDPDRSKGLIVDKILDFGLNSYRPFTLNKEKKQIKQDKTDGNKA